MSIAELAQATPPLDQPIPTRQRHNDGFEYEWDGNTGTIGKALEDKPRTWDDLIREADLDPNEVEVVGDPQIRGWDAAIGGGQVRRMRYFRIHVRRKTLKTDLDELVKAAKRKATAPRPAKAADAAFVLALGDLQLGKPDGDGIEGTVERFFASTAKAVDRYKRLRRTHGALPIYLFHLGDCIEGMVSQGGANTWRTSHTVTEQVRAYRRLLIEQVKSLAGLTEKLVVAGVPGNHDEAHRPLHTYGDSWAIDTIAALKDALDLAGNYDHVAVHAPARDELTLTFDVAGTVVGLAHGHQFGRGPDGWAKWWQGQQHGRQPIGDADILLAGHRHHLTVVQQSERAFIQVPALESESTWFRHRAGEGGRPGVVTMLAGGGGWRALEVL